MTVAFPNTDAPALPPALAPGQEGVAIHVALAPRPGAADGEPPMLLLSGRFALNVAERTSLRSPIHRALVLVITRGAHEGGATAPFRTTALFADDESRAGDVVSGAFQIDAHAMADLNAPGTYHVHCALDGLLSNLVTYEVRASGERG